jgi:hypothetical protein
MFDAKRQGELLRTEATPHSGDEEAGPARALVREVLAEATLQALRMVCGRERKGEGKERGEEGMGRGIEGENAIELQSVQAIGRESFERKRMQSLYMAGS